MFNQFIQPSYWFTLAPAQVDGMSGTLIFGFFVLLFVLGIVMKIVSKQRVKDTYLLEVARKGITLLVTMGLLGSVLYFFSYERIRFFGARFWYVIWLIGLAYWIFCLVRFVKTEVPTKRQEEKSKAEHKKYFPTKKK